MSEFTPEQVERAAEALWFSQSRTRFAHCCHFDLKWAGLIEDAKALHREAALAVLSAAGAPEKVAPVVYKAALAEVLYDTWNFELGEHVIPYMNDRARAKLAAAVAAYLRGESK